jgi:LacI family transcriptional regulator, galactose operon repressor
MADGRATLATIAASAGVSVATVSKVLNGRTDVAPATRRLVQDLLKQHDYVGRRSTWTRSTAPERPSVELLFHGRFNAYGVEILDGTVDAAAEAGVDVVVSRRPEGRPDRRADDPAAWAGGLIRSGRRAVVAVVNEFAPGLIATMNKLHLPLVVIDPLNQQRARVTSVGSTNFAGGVAATQHLLGLGHRRIGYVGGPPTAACNTARMHGYRAAMEMAGVPVPDDHVRQRHFLYDDGLLEGAALLDLPSRPTAVFAASDEIALGVIEAARMRGLRVPEDLSVVGFDDTQVAVLSSPQLTTVRQPLREMGAVALRTALRLADGETLESHHVELATQLVVRRSTAPAG